mgnify:CR=1 FL=1
MCSSTNDNQRDLHRLLEKFDCFGWVPSIRGALSLDLTGQFSNILGDVDCHSVVVKNFNKLTSEQFVAATSLISVNDRKHGDDYDRLFRYFFIGAIHNQKRNQIFLDNYKLCEDKDVKEVLDKEGALLGTLLIKVEQSYNLTEQEVEILTSIKKLEKLKQSYQKDFYEDAVSLAILDCKRKEMKTKWETLENMINNLTKDNGHIIYSFDIFLSRDGILLIKDISSEQSKNTYFQNGTPSDYTQNIPLHRLFKCAMNFIKYLFHYNYHHNIEHDTYLPASNLHPLRNSLDKDFNRIFKHQLDAFMQPITRLKRNNFKQYPIDPNGIICYARAFIQTCYCNGLISKDKKESYNSYLSIQETEINHLTRHHKTQLSTVVLQRNFIFIISAVLALTVAVVKLIGTIIKIPQIEIGENVSNQSVIACISLVFILFLGWGVYEMTYARILKKEFRHQSDKNYIRNIFLRNSNLKKARLSISYILYLWMQERFLSIGKKMYIIFKILLIISTFISVVWIMRYVVLV